jgi:hypothetical protein
MIPAGHADAMRELFGFTLRTLDEGLEFECMMGTSPVPPTFGNLAFR